MGSTIGIIGAGMAGLTAAHQLKQEGYEVTVFEKSTSPGGRMATRRVGNGRMDHGAVFFTVRTEAFQKQVDEWVNEGAARHWFGDDHPRYVGTEGMNPLMKQYAKGLTIQLETKITDIQYEDDKVMVADENGNRHLFDSVVLTSPLPQTIEVLNGSTLPISKDQRAELGKITFEPSYVGLFDLKFPVEIGEKGLLDDDLPKGILKIVANDQKGITDSPLVSVYMDGEWTKSHDSESKADILSDILNRFRRAVPDQEVAIAAKQLKRWQYSQAEAFFPATYVKLDHLPVYLAGDCFLDPDDEAAGSRVESAYLSGVDVAGAIHKDRKDAVK
ncbi:NAD(P)/FAD-dependent oxidoreductase [Salisediminibacterium beveridgei]|uniref:FAD dependent oxidoreductase n=1 Tax=Salisediminibacterium beveridgei TaxID=632773 RepID=A0A1D7QY19_9BACI|nr:FAD-dependent oxidoreductase [Salisediminibacterium beveridgei]AOM83905.1 FAD dependent oxidoreductase [Salisediminibacterium beveridgei]